MGLTHTGRQIKRVGLFCYCHIFPLRMEELPYTIDSERKEIMSYTFSCHDMKVIFAKLEVLAKTFMFTLLERVNGLSSL